MLICPTCHGHFEAILYPDKAYVCATRRRKPGTCTNTLKLPMQLADDVVLDMIEGEVLGERYINELLAMVGKAEWDDTARLTADRARLTAELERLHRSIAKGIVEPETSPLLFVTRRLRLHVSTRACAAPSDQPRTWNACAKR